MGDKIKAFGVAHGEKIGTGVIAVVAVMLVWAAIGREGLEPGREPADLEQKAQSARSNIDRAQWDEQYGRRPELVNYDSKSVMNKVVASNYKVESSWNPRLFEEKLLREDPVLLTASELETHVGYGPIALQQKEETLGGLIDEGPVPPRGRPPRGRRPGGGIDGGLIEGPIGEAPGMIDEGVQVDQSRQLPQWAQDHFGGAEVGTNNVEGRRWIVVNALAPLAKQLETYEQVFRDAEGYDPQADVPQYMGYFVERADITGGSAPKWDKLATFTGAYVRKATEDWALIAEEIVEPKYVDPRLVHPLAPLLLRDWGMDVTHSKVPLAPTPEELEQMRMQQQNNVEPETETEEPFDPFGGFGDTPQRGRQPGYRGRMLDEGAPMRRAPRGRVVRGEGGMIEDNEPAEHLLLRFFDFTVEPGHTYQYRVRLVLLDPNYSRDLSTQTSGEGAANEPALLPERILTPEAIARRKEAMNTPFARYRFTSWSEPTAPVSVPHTGEILAGPVEAASPAQFNGEPSVEAFVEDFDMSTGRTATTTREMWRGSIGKFIAETEVIDPATRQIIREPSQTFDTDSIILDIRGGERMLRSDERPGQILVMNSAGQLEVRSELQDEAEVQFYKDLFRNDTGEGLLDGGEAPPEMLEGGLELLEGPRGRGRNRRPPGGA